MVLVQASAEAVEAVQAGTFQGKLSPDLQSVEATWSNAALEAWERKLHAWPLHPVDTEGFEKAEVTAGGVDTDGLHARTMEARSVPGLFFIGEVVDVTGWLGGFNFQWAWASGFSAGQIA